MVERFLLLMCIDLEMEKIEGDEKRSCVIPCLHELSAIFGQIANTPKFSFVFL